MEDNGSKLGGLGADSKVGENQGSSLPLNLNRDVVSEDLRKARLDMNMGPNPMTSNRGPKSPLKCFMELTMIMGKEYPFRLWKGLLLTLCLHLLEKTMRKEKPNQTEKMKWRVLL
ncbi:hypothetical protein U1Q18_040772 [Sarracenia purpurea var. burkii]